MPLGLETVFHKVHGQLVAFSPSLAPLVGDLFLQLIYNEGYLLEYSRYKENASAK